MNRSTAFLFTAAFFLAGTAGAEMTMSGMLGDYPMTREASGTSWVPDSSPHEGRHVMAGPWMLMLHGYLTAGYDGQGGHRGGHEGILGNMLMGMAQRPVGAGTIGFRGMVSLEPLMGPAGYPMLLQTGETANGRTPLIDRQHPHDLFMEMAVTGSIPVADRTSLFVYAGLPGEPALGPAAFMHRASGMDDPEAPLSHHWLDSTHVSFGVLTAGVVIDRVKVEASAFRGREPDQHRWNIESPKLDSWSGRLTFNLAEDWSMQVSQGHLHSPEQLEPDDNVDRTTASLTHNRRLSFGNMQSMVAWGRNRHTGGHAENAYLLESDLRFLERNTVFGRAENLESAELARGDGTANVSRLSLGYIREILESNGIDLGVGGAGSVHFLPHSLERIYGDTPVSGLLFVRAKIAG